VPFCERATVSPSGGLDRPTRTILRARGAFFKVAEVSALRFASGVLRVARPRLGSRGVGRAATATTADDVFND